MLDAHTNASADNITDSASPWDLPADNEREGWIVSYIDVLTLLLTLFVLLLAFQKVSPAHTQPIEQPQAAAAPKPDTRIAPEPAIVMTAVSGTEAPAPGDTAAEEAINTAAAFSMAADQIADVQPETVADLPLASEVAAIQAEPAPITATTVTAEAAPEPPAVAAKGSVTEPDVSPATTPAAEIPAAEPTENATDTALQTLSAQVSAALGEHVEVTGIEQGVNLEISDNVLFISGSADLSAPGQALVRTLSPLLNGQPLRISVEGHTDNVPIRSHRYPSNWELSAARASSVTRALIEAGVPGERLRAIGYAETRPRAANDEESGRARNRRVSLVVHIISHADETAPTSSKAIENPSLAAIR